MSLDTLPASVLLLVNGVTTLLPWCISEGTNKCQGRAERPSHSAPPGCHFEHVVGLSEVQGLGGLSDSDLLSTRSLVKRETLSLSARKSNC